MNLNNLQLFGHKLSPACVIVERCFRKENTPYTWEPVTWDELHDANHMKALGAFTGQIPFVKGADKAGEIQVVSDSLLILEKLFGPKWLGSSDFHLFRFADIHLNAVLQQVYWAARTNPSSLKPGGVAWLSFEGKLKHGVDALSAFSKDLEKTELKSADIAFEVYLESILQVLKKVHISVDSSDSWRYFLENIPFKIEPLAN